MRLTADEYFLQGAEWAATRGTCYRRKVGCILVNRRGHIIGTGYNGVEAGAPHCNEEVAISKTTTYDMARDKPMVKVIWGNPNACEGAKQPSGMGLELCEAIHAEQNALLQCRDVFDIVTCYVTHSPCVHCVKLLMGTSCKRIVFRNRYAHDEAASLKWLKKNNNVQNVQREWLHIQGQS